MYEREGEREKKKEAKETRNKNKNKNDKKKTKEMGRERGKISRSDRFDEVQPVQFIGSLQGFLWFSYYEIEIP